MVFEGTTGLCERIYRFNSKWVRQKEKYPNSKWIWRIIIIIIYIFVYLFIYYFFAL